MRFTADEGCDAALVAALRADGHDVRYVAESMPGATDDNVLATTFAEQGILITEDKDFGELVFRLRLPAISIILLRLHPDDRAFKVTRLRETIANLGDELVGSFVVVQKDKTRVRSLR